MSVVLTTMRKGALTIEGLFNAGSNYTFLVQTHYQDLRISAVYKPTTGERPLWDFPRGTLAKREVAAFVVSEMLGWELVPPTVYRDGPHGHGSVQYYVSTIPGEHYFSLRDEKRAASKHVAVYDYIVNNADRKGSHVVVDKRGELWLLDHGICFHQEYKLRTVIWDFAGEAIPDAILANMLAFRAKLDTDNEHVLMLRQLLTSDELSALECRTDDLLCSGCFPELASGPNYPWPPM